MTTLLIIFLLSLALFGLPLYIVIGGIALTLAMSLGEMGNQWQLFYTHSYGQLAAAPAFVSIPLFAFAGYLMAESKTSHRLVRLFDALMGWMPGGLIFQIVVLCSFFTVFTGASGITIVALGTLLYPILLKAQYPERYSLGLLTASGSLGLLLPPSLPLILYGVIASDIVKNILPPGMDVVEVFSINALFWAAIIPGIIRMMVVAGHGAWVSQKIRTPRKPFKLGELWLAFRHSFWEAMLPFLILGLLFTGLLDIPQVALLTVVYIFIVEVFIYRDLHLTRDIPRVCTKALKLVGSIFIILMSALYLSNVFIGQQIPDKLFEVLQPYITNKWVFLLVLNLFLIVVGCLLDVFSAILVVVPLILPLAMKFDIHPVYLGIVFLANLELGYLTPPVGMNLFISSITFKKPVIQLYRVSVPFLGLLALSLLLIIFVPQLSLWLPSATGSLKITDISQINRERPDDDLKVDPRTLQDLQDFKMDDSKKDKALSPSETRPDGTSPSKPVKNREDDYDSDDYEEDNYNNSDGNSSPPSSRPAKSDP